MKRRSFIKNTVALGAASAFMASVIPQAFGASGSPDAHTPGTIVHSVYFWLKKSISPSEEKEFLKFFEALRKIPGVKSLTFGKPAPTTKREVTDNSFDYNLIVTFARMEDINSYETHPEHLKAAGEFSKYWVRVQVRDTMIG